MDEIPCEVLEDIPDAEKEYMMFLLKLLNNFLLDNKVPEWFSIKKVTFEPEKETE